MAATERQHSDDRQQATASLPWHRTVARQNGKKTWILWPKSQLSFQEDLNLVESRLPSGSPIPQIWNEKAESPTSKILCKSSLWGSVTPTRVFLLAPSQELGPGTTCPALGSHFTHPTEGKSPSSFSFTQTPLPCLEDTTVGIVL